MVMNLLRYFGKMSSAIIMSSALLTSRATATNLNTIIAQAQRQIKSHQIESSQVTSAGYIFRDGKQVAGFIRTENMNYAFGVNSTLPTTKEPVKQEEPTPEELYKQKLEKEYNKTIVGTYTEKELKTIENILQERQDFINESSASEFYGMPVDHEYFKPYIQLVTDCIGENILLSSYNSDINSLLIGTEKNTTEFKRLLNAYGYKAINNKNGKEYHFDETSFLTGIHVERLNDVYRMAINIPASEIIINVDFCVLRSNVIELIEEYIVGEEEEIEIVP